MRKGDPSIPKRPEEAIRNGVVEDIEARVIDTLE